MAANVDEKTITNLGNDFKLILNDPSSLNRDRPVAIPTKIKENPTNMANIILSHKILVKMNKSNDGTKRIIATPISLKKLPSPFLLKDMHIPPIPNIENPKPKIFCNTNGETLKK